MKLSYASQMSLEESYIYLSNTTILEDGEGPRWRFDYSNWHTDPSPDILLLGSYQHPHTKNNLVGGINLHYLNKQQIENLSRALPQIMSAGNLYGRYHAGKRLVPDVFEHSYRTYNAEYIHGVRQDTMYPKYGYMKTAADWLKKKIGGLFKSKAQRQKDAEPKYPDDLTNMQDRLNQVVQQLQRNPPANVQPDTPEMQAARDAFFQFRRDQTEREIDRQENIPLQRTIQNFDQYQQPEQYGQPQQYQQPQQYEQPQHEQPEQQDPRLAQAEFDSEREKNKQKLLNPNNDLNLDESIVYYSPIRGKYVIEPAYGIVHSSW